MTILAAACLLLCAGLTTGGTVWLNISQGVKVEDDTEYMI